MSFNKGGFSLSVIISWINENKFSIVLMLITIIELIFGFKLVLNINNLNHRVAVAFGIVLLVMIIISIAIIYFCMRKKGRIELQYGIILLFFSIIFLCVFLPFTVPDEAAHFWSSYRISDYFLFKMNQVNETGFVARQCDIDFYNNISSNQLNFEYFLKVSKNFSLFSENNNMVMFDSTYVDGSPFAYLLSGFGIALARILNLGAIPTFYLGRIMNIVLYIVITLLALKITPIGKMSIFAISCLPMSLQLIASYSYDGFTIAICILYVSWILYACYKKEPLNKRDLIAGAIIGMIMAPSKVVYSPLLLLFLLIPNKQFKTKNKKRVYCIKFGLIVLGLLFLGLTMAKNVGNHLSITTNWDGGTKYTLAWILDNPCNTIKIFMNTLMKSGDDYLSTLVGNGLGWLQICLPLYVYGIYFFILVYSFLKRDMQIGPAFSFFNKSFFCVILCISVTLVMLSMFLGWTSIGSDVILGVQGRYFIPLLPLLLPIVRSEGIIVNANNDRKFLSLILFGNMMTIMMIIYNILEI